MFNIKLIIPIALIIVMSTCSLYSQEKAELKFSHSVNSAGTETTPFKLHKSQKTQFDNTTIIKFELGEEANVLLTVCDSKGKIVLTLVDDIMDPGVYNVNFKSAAKIAPGEFTYKLEVKGISGIRNVFAVK